MSPGRRRLACTSRVNPLVWPRAFSVPGFVGSTAAGFLIVEIALVVLLRQAEPGDSTGMVYAVLLGGALIGNFGAAAAAALWAVAERRIETDVLSELAHIVSRARDLPSAAREAGRHVATTFGVRFRSVGSAAAAGEQPPGGLTLHLNGVPFGVFELPPDLPRAARRRLLRMLPTLEAFLAAAGDHAHNSSIEDRHTLEQFFELTSDLMVISDQGKLLEVNPAFEKALGYTVDELAPAPFELVPPEDMDRLSDQIRDLSNGRGPVRFENRATTRDGSLRWIEWSVTPHRGLFYAVGRDVTAQREEKEQLRETRMMLEASRDTLRELAEHQAALRRVATLVARGGNPVEVFDVAYREMVQSMHVADARLLRFDDDTTATILAGRPGAGAKNVSGRTRLTVADDELLSEVLSTGEPTSQKGAFRTAFGVPVIVDGRVWGMLSATSAEREPLSFDSETRIADFADLIATAIASTATREQLDASQERLRSSRDRLRQLARHQTALRRVAELVACDAEPAEVFNAVAEEMANILDVYNATVSRYDGDDIVIAALGRPEVDLPNPPAVGERFPIDGDDVAAIVRRTGRPARVDSHEHVVGASAARLREMGIRSMVGVPIMVGEQLWGVAAVGSRGDPLPVDTEVGIADFADLVATAIANAAAREQLDSSRSSLRELARRQSALRRVAELVAREAQPAAVLHAVAEEIAGILDVHNATVVRYDGDATIVEAVARADSAMPNLPVVGERFVMEGDNIAAMVQQEGRPARIDKYENASGRWAERIREGGLQSVVGVPILVGSHLWGVLAVASRTTPMPPETEARMADFADLVATAIANAATRDQLRASRDSLRDLARHQTALRRVAELVAREAEPRQVFRAVAEETAGCLDVYNTTVGRFDDDAIVVEAVGRAEPDLPNPPAVGERFPLTGDHIAPIIRRTGRPARMDSHDRAAGESAARIRDVGVRCMVGVPITVGAHVWGVLAAASRNEPLPHDIEARMADFADLVATSIANAATRFELQASRDSLRDLARQQTALRQVAELVAREAEPAEVFTAVAEQLGQCLDVYNTTVIRFDGEELVMEAVGRVEELNVSAPTAGQRFSLDGDHVAPMVLRTGGPARMDTHDAAAGSTAAFIRELGIKSMVAVPIVVGGHVWGAVGVASRTGPLPPDTETRMTDFADLVGTSIANAATRSELQASRDSLRELADNLSVLARQQAALRRVATLVAQGVSTTEVFSAVAEEMADCLNVGSAEVLRFEDNGAEIVVAASHAAPGVAHLERGERLSSTGDNVAARVLNTRRAARMDSWEGAEGPIAERVRELGVRSRVGAPIVVDERLWGLALVATTEPDPLPPDTEARTVEFAELVATAIAAATTREELIASRARIVAAADDARRRLERDIHDGAQQRIVSLGLKLRLAQESVPPEANALKDELSEAVSGLTDVFTELQEISRGIHPAVLSTGGLAAALKTLARRASVPVTLDVAIDDRMPEPIQVAAYYVVAEALTNAAKHAQASEVTVRAHADDTNLTLLISDDGVGGADSGRGSGLIGLKDRIEVLGGRMRVASPPGQGTTLDITIPHHTNGAQQV
jgi:PAS domain S-box-containing protein